MGTTKIEWTATTQPDGTVTPGKTWNPVRGCSKLSLGCRNCYAIGVAYRFSGEGQPYEGLAEMTPHGPEWTGEIALVYDHLDDPRKWRKPTKVFVNSMSDLFHEGIPDEFIAQVFQVMAQCERHTFIVLTKRPQRMQQFVSKWIEDACWEESGCPINNMPPNIWLGVSVEDQKAADERIPLLMATEAQVKFLSCEPLLGEVRIPEVFMKPLNWGEGDVSYPDGAGLISWIICGGESGPNARPMSLGWARSLRDQCIAAKVPFFFKQHGEWLATEQGNTIELPVGTRVHFFDCPYLSAKVGKEAAGSLLDGKTWNEFPEVHS